MVTGEEGISLALKACADRLYAVPGYPVTGLTALTGAELVLNEKAGLEYALGDSLSGRRAALITKHAGLNTCADPLVTATVQGLCGGVVVVAGDDVEAVGSQTAQDSRYYGEVACVPVLEPGPKTALAAVEEAFRASERFSRVSILRLTPPLLSGPVDQQVPVVRRGTGSLAPPGLTMHGKVTFAQNRATDMETWSRWSVLNRDCPGPAGAGACPGDARIGTVYPPPGIPSATESIREYGRPFCTDHRHWTLPPAGGAPESFRSRGFSRTFCVGCPYIPLISLLKEEGMRVICDSGCAILAMNPPWEVGAAAFGLGSSVAVAARSTGVALAGDGAILHSGINALIDIWEKQVPVLVLVMANGTMAMTGGQEIPDVLRYLRFADPVVVGAENTGALAELIRPPQGPRVIVVQGRCPGGSRHATVEY